MNPEIALQIFSDIAKIAGTALAIYFAMIIFALRDKDLVNVIVKNAWARLAIILAPFLFIVVIVISLLTMSQIDTAVPYDFGRLLEFILLFAFSLIIELVVFFVLMWEKYSACKPFLESLICLAR